jgi:ankyrin repeat protein
MSLVNSARFGDLVTLKTLLNQGANINSRNGFGKTPLHLAAQQGYTNIVKELLKRGARVNPRDRWGITPLHLAVMQERTNIVKDLLKAGAKPEYRTNNGRNNAFTMTTNYKIRRALEAAKASRAATKFQNYRKKSIARKRAPLKNVTEKVFSPARVRTMMNKYGNNWLNKI